MSTPVLEASAPPRSADAAAWERRLEREATGYDLEPWTLLPDQFADATTSPQAMAEKRLMAAVLTDAMQVYLKYHPGPTGTGGALFRESERWIESTSRSWLLSFENVCDVLGIDPARLRQTLRSQAASGRRVRLPVGAGRLGIARRR